MSLPLWLNKYHPELEAPEPRNPRLMQQFFARRQPHVPHISPLDTAPPPSPRLLLRAPIPFSPSDPPSSSSSSMDTSDTTTPPQVTIPSQQVLQQGIEDDLRDMVMENIEPRSSTIPNLITNLDDEEDGVQSDSCRSEWSFADIEDAPVRASSAGIMGILEEELAAEGLTPFTSMVLSFADDDSNIDDPRPYHSTIPRPPTDLHPEHPTLFDARPIIDAFERHSDTISLIEELDRII